ncbi:MAG: nucleotidyl transferase AbiEii/AbiGii toxin family protein [Burkholderiales bacterium]|nr:MAG: nucleotidyl transferase AbiEii/AbiGii toxin family protein [Burkholderiales bacterium]
MSITREDVQRFRQSGSWRRLDQIACDIVAAAQASAGRQMHPVLGGGTRLMLVLEHRISHDIDLFVHDAQWIPYLSPRLNDGAEALCTGYEEAADFLKLAFEEGEVDFIVRASLLGLPEQTCAETTFALDHPAEVLAKKLFYRGATLTPRDLYDWWALETMKPGLVPAAAMGRLLVARTEVVSRALAMLARAPTAQVLWNEILAPERPALLPTVEWGQRQLLDYGSAVQATPRDAEDGVRRPGV